MKFPRFRFTIRRMIIAVAIGGEMLGLCRWWLIVRPQEFRRLAILHQKEYFKVVRLMMKDGGKATQSVKDTMSWRMKMSRKYSYAAKRPWLPVAPDPPEPK